MIEKDRSRLIVEKLTKQVLSNNPLIISFIYSPQHGFIGYDIIPNEIKKNEILIYVPDSSLDFIKKYVQRDDAETILLENSPKTRDLCLENKLKEFQTQIIFIDDRIVINKDPQQIIRSFEADYSPYQRNKRLIH